MFSKSKLKVLSYACVIVMLALACYTVHDLNGGSFDFSNREIVLVVTDSMNGDVHDFAIDSYPADTIVVFENVPSHEVRLIRVGDVVAYHSGDMLITHRVIGIDLDKSYLLVKGDNASLEEKIAFEDVVGVVVGTNEWIGTGLGFVKENLQVVLLVAFAILICSAIIHWYRNMPEQKRTGLKKGAALSIAVIAVFCMAFAGIGYAYTAATENSGNSVSSEYSVISQSNYTYCSGTDFTYYSVTERSSYYVQVGFGDQSGKLTADEDCFLSLSDSNSDTKSDKNFTTVVIKGGSYAGTYTIDLTDLTLVGQGSAPGNPGVTQTVDGPLDFTVEGLVYESVEFDNKTIRNSISVVYNELSKTYKISGQLNYQNNSGGDAMDVLGMPDSDHYGISFVVKNKSPVTRYFMTSSNEKPIVELFNSYYGKKIGTTNVLKITNVGNTGDKKIKITSDAGFAALSGDWRYIMKVTDKSNAENIQYAISDGEIVGDSEECGWIYYHKVDGIWIQQDSLILSQNAGNVGYDTELYLAGPGVNIDSPSLIYVTGMAEPIYVGDDENRKAKDLIENGTIRFVYDSSVE